MTASFVEIPQASTARAMRRDNRGRLRVAVSVAVLLAIALLLRLPFLTTRSIWLDEAASWRAASFGFGRLVRCMQFGNHIPTYFFALKAWMTVFGESLASLRGLSVFCGLITVGAMYLLGGELYLGSRLFVIDRASHARRADMQHLFALTTALLAAVSPFQINASIEARPYAMGTALTALTAWALLKAVRCHKLRDWTTFGVFAGGGMYVHHFVMLSVAAQFAFLAALIAAEWSQRKKRRAVSLFKSTVICGGVLAIAYIPCLALAVFQHRRVQAQFWGAPIDEGLLRRTLVEFVSPVGVGGSYMDDSGLALAAAIVLIAAALFSVRGGRYGDWSVFAAGLLPFIFVALLSLRKPVWEPRFFRFAHLYLLAVLAIAAWRLLPRTWNWRAANAATLLILGLLVAGCFWRGREIPDRQGMRMAMQKIAAEIRPGEIVVADSLNHYLPAKFYAPEGIIVKLLDNATNGFWGHNHVILDDRISDRDLREALKAGVWSLNHYKVAHKNAVQDISPLGSAVVLRSFTSDYDRGVPPWTIWVSYCLDRDVAASEITEFDAANCAEVDDWDLQRMQGLARLRRMRLDRTSVGDRGLAKIGALVNLEELSAAHTQVSDAGLKHLSALEKLETLSLDGNRISWGLEAIAHLPRLRSLNAAGTNVTDDTLVALGKLNRLETLNLDHTLVTDAGVERLLALPRLSSVSLCNTRVSAAGVRRLEQASRNSNIRCLSEPKDAKD